MTTATVSRWAQAFLLVSAVSLVVSQAGALAGLGRPFEVTVGLYGFVLPVVFGKAYSLVPSYFERELVWPRAMALQFVLTVTGVGGLALATLSGLPAWPGSAGALAYGAGVVVFALTLGATIRDNVTGAQTGTGGANEHRQSLDRFANAFVPIALAYLAVGTYDLVAIHTPLPAPFGTPAQVTHLLAVGFALLVLFSVGTRLLPRFLVADPPPRLGRAVLPAGAVGPLCLVAGFPAGRLFQVGAVLVGFAVCAFALVYGVLFARTDRDRIGLYGPLAGVCLGVLGVALGVWFAVAGLDTSLAGAHLRLNLFGLLGTSIVGVLYQFYPPAIADWPLAGDRLAGAVLAALTLGVLVAAAGAVVSPAVETAGHALLVGAGAGHLYLLAGTIRTGTRR